VPVSKSDLGPLQVIKQGGNGCVYRTDYQLKGDTEHLAYKEFTQKHGEQARSAEMTVRFWEQLPPPRRRRLAQMTVWPRALVRDSSRQVCGLLMPLLPDHFFWTRPDHINGGTKRLPLELQQLIGMHPRGGTPGAPRSADALERHVLLAKLAYVLALLHRLAWVYGDLSFKNVAYALDPPRIKVMDCDAAAPVADLSREQGNTPFWFAPECEGSNRLQDPRTDVYKLGLMVLRCLTPGSAASQTHNSARIVGVLDSEGERLVKCALSRVPDERPSAREIFLYLKRAAEERIVLPVLHIAEIRTPVRLRGQDALVRYEVEGADELELETANGRHITLDPTNGVCTASFRPEASGLVTLTARNRFGSVRAELGDVELYELPKFDIGRVTLPRPQIPSLPTVHVPHLASAAVLDRPVLGVGTVPVTASLPDIARVFRPSMPEPVEIPELPRLDVAVSAAGGLLRTSILSSATHVSDAAREAVARAVARLGEERVIS
jgi:hypothetical protein